MTRSDAKRAERLDRIARAAEALDITGRPELWGELSRLADEAEFSGARVPPDGIVLTGERFQGIVNISVRLRYWPQDEEPFTDTWTFPAIFEGRFRNGEVAIDSIEVNTTSFFMGEEYAETEA